MRRRSSIALAALTACLGACAPTPDAVRVVGSSTVYPFAVAAAERVEGATVVIEQTGSGGGHKIFCAPNSRADVALSSRARLPEEAQGCTRNGRAHTVEIALGRDAIVLVHSQSPVRGPDSLTREQLWRALAAELPGPDCAFASNTARQWSDVDASLPDQPIRVYGPPPTSGTRDAFLMLAVEAGARRDPCMAALERRDAAAFRARAGRLRQDGAWIDAGENDPALLSALGARPGAVGVVGRGGLLRGETGPKPLRIEGVLPVDEPLRGGRYALVRPLYLYADHAMDAPTRAFVDAMISERALGPGGYLREAGLIPPGAEERRRQRAALERPGP